MKITLTGDLVAPLRKPPSGATILGKDPPKVHLETHAASSGHSQPSANMGQVCRPDGRTPQWTNGCELVGCHRRVLPARRRRR